MINIRKSQFELRHPITMIAYGLCAGNQNKTKNESQTQGSKNQEEGQSKKKQK